MNLQTEIVASERIVLLTHNNIEEARQRNIVLGREVFKVETGEKIGVTEQIEIILTDEKGFARVTKPETRRTPRTPVNAAENPPVEIEARFADFKEDKISEFITKYLAKFI